MNPSSPLVSIIIATFNSGKTIRRCLNSVVSQNFQSWECIIIDGASSDDTMSIVKEFAGRDARIRFVSEKDHGIYDAFNKGLRMAGSEWIHYLGSDDRLTQESFSSLLSGNLSDPNIAVVSGSCYIVKTDGKTKVQKSVGWGGCHQAKITRKSVLEQMKGFDEKYKILADKDLYLRIKNSGYSVINCEPVVAYFSMDGMSQKFSTIWERYKENRLILSNDKTESFPKLHAFQLMAKAVLLYPLNFFKSLIRK